MTPSVVGALSRAPELADLKPVGFVFAQFLHRFGSTRRLNDESGVGGIRNLHVDGRHSGLPAKLGEENLDGTIQSRLVMAGD